MGATITVFKTFISFSEITIHAKTLGRNIKIASHKAKIPKILYEDSMKIINI